jgi:hypothetical protein
MEAMDASRLEEATATVEKAFQARFGSGLIAGWMC